MNTLASYLRFIFAGALALFTSRWVLGALGQTDFGLFSLIVSITTLLLFSNGVLMGSTQRFLSYHVGRDSTAEVNRWFQTAFILHLGTGMALLALGYGLGEIVLHHGLSIPPERLQATRHVFQVYMLANGFVIAASPFSALFAAKQRIVETSLWGLAQSFLCFLLAWKMTTAGWSDRLTTYATGMALITVLIQVVLMVRAWRLYPEAHLRGMGGFERSRAKAIMGYAGWTFFPSLAATFKDHGSAVLLNLFFGPRANAPYGIASQVSLQTNQLSTSLLDAVFPEIVRREGKGEREGAVSLAISTSKFGTLLSLVLAVPLWIEMEHLLALWLGTVPDHAAALCRWILATLIADRLSSGYHFALNATGQIARFQTLQGIVYFCTLPFAWLLFHLGGGPSSIGFSLMFWMLMASALRIHWGRRILDIPIQRWFREVLGPCAWVLGASGMTGLTLTLVMSPSAYRVLVVLLASGLVSLIVLVRLALTPGERSLLSGWILSVLRKRNPGGSGPASRVP